MHRSTILAIIFVLLFGCSEIEKKEPLQLTKKQKTKIESFSINLVRSINEFDFSIINNSWNNKAFKGRILKQITRTQGTVLKYIFEKKLSLRIKVENLNIVHRVNSDKGKVSFLRLDHFDSHSELLLLITFDGTYDFFKYRIEYLKNQPNLTDFFHYTDNLWYSEKVIKMLQLNSKYGAFSDKRHLANESFSNSKKSLSKGDTLEALYYLYDIPVTHQSGNWLSLQKINLAVALGDSILSQVIATEYENNKSLYMKYLYSSYFGDTSNLKETYRLFATELGESETLDSLVKSGSVWSVEKQ